jgi:hypothetical protein
MNRILTDEQVAHFKREGYVSPVRVMSEEAARAVRDKLEAYEKTTGGPLRGEFRHKSHLLFKFLSDVVHDEKIVDAIEDLYGGDLLCWTTNFFIKEANTPAFVSWHQDSTYWGLSSPDVVTAWVALTESNLANGAMEVIPGTHLMDQVPHKDTFDDNNLLSRGQEVAVEVDASKAVRLDLQPGRCLSTTCGWCTARRRTRPTTDASGSPSATSRRRCGNCMARMRRRSCAGSTASTPSSTSRCRRADRQPEMIELHQQLTSEARRSSIAARRSSPYTDPAARGAFR